MKPFPRRTFIIKGIGPLLMHNPAGTMKLSTGKAKVKKILTPEEEAELGAYRIDGKGSQLYGPAEGFKGGIVTAGRGRRIEKVGASTVLMGAVFNIPDLLKCPLIHQKTHKPIMTYVIDVRRAVIPSSGAAVLRARPEVTDWMTEVILEIDEERMALELVLEFFELAGRNVGWMDHRPEKGGYHGRYEVELKE
jgi:hypothetical protein